MRRPMVVANWKMNTRASDAYILATSIRNAVSEVEGIEVVICPPMPWLSELSEILKRDGRVSAGAQNMYFEPEGAFTGEVSPLMIRDIAKYVIVGHSERRSFFHESDMIVNEKVSAAIKYGIIPIICVGERHKGEAIDESVRQLDEALERVPKNRYRDLVVAYEPSWAIGGGGAAPISHAVHAITKIREKVGAETPILYGGSVNAEQVREFAFEPSIDGVLVGSASLKVESFVSICKTWSEGKSFK